jgi:SecD/SecF fusion protein
MQNIVSKLLLILVIVVLCTWAIFPPQEKIRLGKDLRGGVSLIYAVRIPDTTPDKRAVLTQTIEVLKERVNPRGVLDISMEPLGLDRIEIVMPLPSEAVKELRDQYEKALEMLLTDAEIRGAQLDEAIRFNRAVEQYGGEGERGRQITQLQEAWNAMQAARTSLEQLEADGAPEPDQIRAAQAVAEAEIRFEDLRQSILRLSLDRPRVVRALNLATTRERMKEEEGKVLIDDVTGEPATLPSPRDLAIDGLKSEFTQLAGALDDLVQQHDEYEQKRTGFDDPQDLIRLLRGAGVPQFHIAVSAGDTEGINVADLRQQLQEVGPENTDSPIARWFPINDTKQWADEPALEAALRADPVTFFTSNYRLVAAERDQQIYLLLYTTDAKSITHTPDRRWSITETFRTVDRLGRPAVSFRLDPAGGRLMSAMSGRHVSKPMAIVLDGEVYSAPTLQSQIGNSGIITGSFSDDELSYLIRVLAAGSLEARLSEEPIAINSLGPSIGKDNLERGLEAFLIAVIAVAIFMMAYYFFAGFVADLALLINGILIFGFMSLIDGTFTLPGLAGIVLTIGMAVDANVLIYERIREELFADEDIDLRAAIREGYRKALSTIIDANVTNLIVCFVLFRTATTEVKGFALTLSIGICATLFTALFVTRQVYHLYTDLFKLRTLAMLPTVVPAVHRALEPSIHWIGLRKIFWPVSLVAITLSIVLVSTRGTEMFDTELRGGVAATMRTRLVDPLNETAGRFQLAQLDVQERIRALAGLAAEEGDTTRGAVMEEFRNASILTVGTTGIDGQGRVTADRFQVKVANPKGIDDEQGISNIVVEMLVEEFGGELDVIPPLTFEGVDATNAASFVSVIEQTDLGENIGETRGLGDVSNFIGGVIVRVHDIEPAVELDDIAKRISQMRGQPDFADCIGRDFEVFGLEPADPNDPAAGWTAVAVAVFDPNLSAVRVDSDVWYDRLATREWELIATALRQPPSLDQVSSFSSAVAQTLAANAVVAVVLSLLGILVYIWVRFGSLRYSFAAIAALVHDVTIALGLLAATAMLGATGLGQMLLIEEFRIDLGVVAALLTIIGYSLNDTIVIMDRIRENRGKLPLATEEVVNRSINQTISRTLLTSVTTLMAVAIMYAEGGSGIRPFTFCLLTGLVVGTYSSVAVAAPLVYRHGDHHRRPEEPVATIGAAEAEAAGV